LNYIVKTVAIQALNRDPIDSFERAVGGDEFDRRKPIEPIRVIKIDSAEVLQPMSESAGQRADQRLSKHQRIMQSITRHMNEVRPPRVIPFSNRDEIVNGPVVSDSEVKKLDTEKKEMTSSEIAGEIIDNILGDAPTMGNATGTDLLKVLSASNTAETTGGPSTVTTIPSEGAVPVDKSVQISNSASVNGNDTEATFRNFKSIDQTLDIIVS
uniref:Pecanex-like protein n=1 Tax=Nippostrongylus brasiliensis TaxID=27835 RepID=A0A0N4XQF4_NIPBR